MGIGGAALLGMIYCLFKIIVSVVKFLAWKCKLNTIGIVKELKSENVKHDKKGKIASVNYTYSLSVNNDGNTYIVDYVEKIAGYKPSKIMLNSSIPVLVDINKKVAKNEKKMRVEIRQWLLGLLASSAILITCLIILTLNG